MSTRRGRLRRRRQDLHARDGRIRLQPANATMTPIYVHESQVRVQGIVVGVMRRY